MTSDNVVLFTLSRLTLNQFMEVSISPRTVRLKICDSFASSASLFICVTNAASRDCMTELSMHIIHLQNNTTK